MTDFNDEEYEEYEDDDLDEDTEDESEEYEKSTSGFTQVPNFILENVSLSIQARLLYCNLLKYAWNKDFCFPTQETLAVDMGLSSRRVRDILKELESKYIKVHRHGFESPNVYELLILPESRQYKKKYKNVFRRKERKKAELERKKRLNKGAKYIRTRRKDPS